MRLEVGRYLVQDVHFGDRQAWEHGTLTIRREQLRALFRQEVHIHDVGLHNVFFQKSHLRTLPWSGPGILAAAP
jgi:hypothetical protein